MDAFKSAAELLVMGGLPPPPLWGAAPMEELRAAASESRRGGFQNPVKCYLSRDVFYVVIPLSFGTMIMEMTHSPLREIGFSGQDAYIGQSALSRPSLTASDTITRHASCFLLNTAAVLLLVLCEKSCRY